MTTYAAPYPMSGAPVLRWEVNGADQVEVWLLSDTGSGLTRTRVLSTDPSGELQVRPGTVDGGQCYAMTGTYACGIEAAGLGGNTGLADPADRPTFDVVPVIG